MGRTFLRCRGSDGRRRRGRHRGPARRLRPARHHLTVYSRDRAIAEPLFEQFEAETGIDVRARYGDPIILAGQIIEDGADSPADVFYGPLSDALGALSAAGRLATLSEEQLDRVPRPTARPEAFHCHNLEHEDMAMMVNFYIV